MSFAKLPLEMQFFIGAPFFAGLLSLLFFWARSNMLSQLKVAKQNQNHEKQGQLTAIEGVVTTPNSLVSPVFETPLAAALWDIRSKGKGRGLTVCMGVVGDKFTIQTTHHSFDVLIKPDDVLTQLIFPIQPKSASNSPVYSFLRSENSPITQRNLQPFIDKQKIVSRILGIKADYIYYEYPIESGKSYTVLGKLVRDKTIASDQYENLRIFSLPFEILISKLSVRMYAFGIASILFFAATVFLYFHITSL